MANLTAFSVGQAISGYDFGNVSNGDTNDALNAFLAGLTYSDDSFVLVGGEGGSPIVLAMDLSGYSANGYALAVIANGAPTIAYATAENAGGMVPTTVGYQNLTDGKISIGSSVEVSSVNATEGWNGVFVGVVEAQSSLTPFAENDVVTGIRFDTSLSVAQVTSIVSSLDFTDGYQEGWGLFVDLIKANDNTAKLSVARMDMGGSYAYAIRAYSSTENQEVYVWASQTVGEYVAEGFQNLVDGAITSSFTVAADGIYQGSVWNGILAGAFEGGVEPTYTDTVTAGTYSAATGIWTDNADYTVTDNGDGTYSATGLIPYGRADSLFAFAGYRFAVKIARDTITSREDLPDGNIVEITVGGEVSQYTKSAFETDGSLIYIAAPVSETLDTPRVVKIAWSIAGSTVEESDFTIYTFDLSGAELAPIPEEAEDESRVAYCITPKISSDKFVKVVAPSGGLRAGQVVNCVALASSVEGVPLNLEVYSPSLPTTATLDSRFYCLIVNGGFENLADGRRPSGNPDYTTYVYPEGDVCQGILLDKNLVFEISGSCISGDTSIDPVADIGRYIVPTNGTYIPSIANAPTDGSCLKIIGTAQFRKGGVLNDAFVSTYIALAIN